jgi:hypothetical protein
MFPVEVDDEIVPALSVFIGLTGPAVVLRVLARVLTAAYFWWDDLCNFIAMVSIPPLITSMAGLTGHR